MIFFIFNYFIFFEENFEKYIEIFFDHKRLKHTQRTHKSDGDLSEASYHQNTLQEVSKYDESHI